MFEKSKADADKHLLTMADALKPGIILLQDRIAKGKFATYAEKDPARKEGMQELLTYLEDAMHLVKCAQGLLTKQRILLLYPAEMGDIVIDTSFLSPETISMVRAAEKKGCRVAGIERVPQEAANGEETS